MFKSNSAAFSTSLDKAVKNVDKKMQKRVRTLVHEGMRRLLRRTPVNTGKAVMNYVASVGVPSASGVRKGFEPVEATNKLSLGAEQLRGPAEAVALATLQGLSFTDPYQNFWISNKADNISGLEAGELPKEPYTPRSPQGMFVVTLAELENLLSSGRI